MSTLYRLGRSSAPQPRPRSPAAAGWSVAFTPDAVPALTSVFPLAWTHHPLLARFAFNAGRGRIAEPDQANWSAWLAGLAEELADPDRLGAREAVAALLTRLLVATRLRGGEEEVIAVHTPPSLAAPVLSGQRSTVRVMRKR